METAAPRYRALPYIFSALLVLVGWGNNLWQLATRDWLSSVFNMTPVVVHNIIAPMFFALAALPLITTVFTRRITPTGGIILLIAGLLFALMPLWTAVTPLGTMLLLIISNYLPLAGAVIAACGFASPVFKDQPVTSSAH